MIEALPLLSFLPASLAPYSSIISIILILIDGVIFGVAAKKGLMSAILIIIGVIIAGLIGLSLPVGLSVSEIVSKLMNLVDFQATHGGTQIVYSFPIFWIIGFAFGLWKG